MRSTQLLLVRGAVAGTALSEEAADERLDEWTSQIAPHVAEAAATHDDAVSVEEWNAAVDELRRALASARAG